MKSSFLTFLWTTCVACAMLPTLARGQSDTLAISGTFQMLGAYGTLGEDLAGVYSRRMDHTWTLTLRGVTYENDYSYEAGDGWYDERYITRAHSTSYTLEFFGPDASTLNAAVSNQLTSGGLTNGAMIELVNQDLFGPNNTGPFIHFYLDLVPENPLNGVAFSCYAYDILDSFTQEYPEFTARQLWVELATIADDRFPNSGGIETWGQLVNINSSVPPSIAPGMTILDGSITEGNQGTRRLDLTVKLSGASSQPITVQYQTVNGTALARSDYQATTGTVTFLPGEIQRTIPISIIGDRKREANETFTLRLTNPSGAYFFDSTATATILNDD